MPEKELLPHLFKTEYRKIISVLCRRFGFEHVEIAEDIASDTFLTAAETWGLKGIPAKPEAWLYTVASNKAVDFLRKKARQERRLSDAAPEVEEGYPALDLSLQNIRDSQLQMMFAICQPLIPPAAQVALALRILCGFGIDEIAGAFLTNRDTIVKRLQRAKDKLRHHQVKIEFPPDPVARLSSVSSTLYLLFNEGYYSRHNDLAVRRDLCLEAMRLTLLLTEHPDTDLPDVNALLALMCFHASRLDARIGTRGEVIRYDEQDPGQWNAELIDKGHFYFNRSAKGTEAGQYHLEAAIAYWHTHKEDTTQKWDNILGLYNRLLLERYSPVAALNRAYAMSKLYGNKAGLLEAQKLKLDGYGPYHHLIGYLCIGDDDDRAIHHLTQALHLSGSESDRENIRRDLARTGQ
ncbi:MAG TPA: sigma-70 family RNA polymerase sigma factor [Dinghuibacter sp.]|uniref:RNA polymerase sigma factor n=1 Tax=Dinghuibacter sp. TaxID=2024697 RepID=UPI002C84111A|nr:sigma-70 family RNA polymerase sigma factor [Dinghuibacter sp.]HTJ13267.1 sigma-70 family RNA polymerase sigma factor [Dinghuibacter sp.]